MMVFMRCWLSLNSDIMVNEVSVIVGRLLMYVL